MTSTFSWHSHGATTYTTHDHFSELTDWSTSPSTEAGLLSLLLTEKVVGRKVSGAEALGQLEAIHSVPGWTFIAETASLATPVIDTRVLMGRQQVTDLHLVNTAAKHNVRLATFDASLKAALTPEDRHRVTVWSG